MALFVDHSSLPTSILKSAGEESKEPNPFRVIGHIEDTPLRLAKAKTLFSVYDYDDNGFIEKADFEAVAENFAKARELPTESEARQKIKELYLGIWAELENVADEDRDGRVSFSELLAYLDKLTHDPALFHQQVMVLSELLFELLDSDGDGSITFQEYSEFACCLRFETSLENFSQLSQKNESMTRVDFLRRLQEFYYSEDPDAQGNVFYGDLKELV